VDKTEIEAWLNHTARKRPRGLRRGAARFIRNGLSTVEKRPIFVLGNQKSGTTVIAALLAEATQLPVTLDLNGLIADPGLQLRLKDGRETFEAFVDEYRYEFSRKIIKEPVLTLFHRELAETFPSAKFVFIVRDPRDNIRSILNRLRIPGDKSSEEATSFAEVRRNPVWALVLDTNWLNVPSGSYIDALAKRWNICSSCYDEERMVLIRYEDFKRNKENCIYRLAEQVEADVRKTIADKVDVQYQFKGNNDLPWRKYFGEQNLRHIEKTCAFYMNRFDYETSF